MCNVHPRLPIELIEQKENAAAFKEIAQVKLKSWADSIVET